MKNHQQAGRFHVFFALVDYGILSILIVGPLSCRMEAIDSCIYSRKNNSQPLSFLSDSKIGEILFTTNGTGGDCKTHSSFFHAVLFVYYFSFSKHLVILAHLFLV